MENPRSAGESYLAGLHGWLLALRLWEHGMPGIAASDFVFYLPSLPTDAVRAGEPDLTGHSSEIAVDDLLMFLATTWFVADASNPYHAISFR